MCPLVSSTHTSKTTAAEKSPICWQRSANRLLAFTEACEVRLFSFQTQGFTSFSPFLNVVNYYVCLFLLPRLSSSPNVVFSSPPLYRPIPLEVLFCFFFVFIKLSLHHFSLWCFSSHPHSFPSFYPVSFLASSFPFPSVIPKCGQTGGLMHCCVQKRHLKYDWW